MSLERIKVWDWAVRATHWLLALLVIANLALEDEFELVHMWIGYSAAVLVILRVLWGLHAGGYASLGYFLPSPGRLKHEILGFIGAASTDRELGHSAIGGLLMLFLMTLVCLLAVTGAISTSSAIDWAESMEGVHELLSSLLIVLVSTHIVAAVLFSWLKGRNLIWAMVTGWVVMQRSESKLR